MAKKDVIIVFCLGEEIGKLGYDEHRAVSFFQYRPEFLANEGRKNLFPLLARRVKQTQSFSRYNNATFRGLPPMIADSLPGRFGETVFNAWLQGTQNTTDGLPVLERLALTGSRGMGALEYKPKKQIYEEKPLSLSDVVIVTRQLLDHKSQVNGPGLTSGALQYLFKVAGVAGGSNPKILLSQSKDSGIIVPGDVVYDDTYEHFIIKLSVDDASHLRTLVEYSYYLAATAAGIEMAESKMIEGKHFAVTRFDRQDGMKKHVLTATGLTGLDHTDTSVSSYENLFDLLVYLKCPHRDVEQLYRRMVFNIVFANHDDHLKNHSFIYDELEDEWNLAPAYDVTYSLNPELNLKARSRVLTVNGKRAGIGIGDLQQMAEKYTIKNYRNVVAEIRDAATGWKRTAQLVNLRPDVIENITANFNWLV